MTDTFSPAQRSEIMRRIKSRHTSAELLLRKALWSMGLRGYRVDVESVRGRPDVAFRRAKLAVFVDGCYWHGCPRHCRMPSSNRQYWERKIRRNVERDKAHAGALRKEGWRVLRFWEHQVRQDSLRAARRVARALGARVKILYKKPANRGSRPSR
jgi:DNA mismatch endonuclease (patch repair protein)